MHQSRLAGFIIDCNGPDLAAAATFWGAALRMDLRALPAAEGSKYVRLVDPEQRLHIEVQAVTHPSRVHLDIESTDVEAEVQRLEALGAKRVARGAGADVVGHGGAHGPALLCRDPAVHAPQVGKVITHKYLAAASVVLMNDSFRYVGEWLGEHSAVLEFKCMLGEIEVDGIDMIEWNDDGRITRFKVMVRPVKALQTLMPLMAAQLAKPPAAR